MFSTGILITNHNVLTIQTRPTAHYGIVKWRYAPVETTRPYDTNLVLTKTCFICRIVEKKCCTHNPKLKQIVGGRCYHWNVWRCICQVAQRENSQTARAVTAVTNEALRSIDNNTLLHRQHGLQNIFKAKRLKVIFCCNYVHSLATLHFSPFPFFAFCFNPDQIFSSSVTL